jgi:putative phage-type endonuclease
MGLSKEQLELRRSGIAASEIAVLAGLSRWSSPVAIYEDKIGMCPPRDESLAADLGTLLEEPLAKLYAERTGLHLAKSRTLRSKVQTIALATPDRIAFDAKRSTRALIADPNECADAVKNVEIKTTTWRLRHEWGAPGTDQVPDYYLAQCQWQMLVCGIRLTDVAVLFDRDEFSIYSVPYNEQLALGLVELAERFWVDHVLARQPPPPDASERYKEFLGRAFPTTNDVVLHLDEGDARAALAAQYGRLKMVEKAIDGELKLLGNQLRTVIGINKGLASPVVGSVSRVWCKPSTGTDWESLARAAIDPVELNEWVVKHQREKRPGYWKLHPRWSDEFKAQLEPELLSVRQRLELSDGGGTEDELRVMEPMQEQ